MSETISEARHMAKTLANDWDYINPHTVADTITELLDEIERLNTILDVAVDWLSKISSADGSGHGDLARRITDMRRGG